MVLLSDPKHNRQIFMIAIFFHPHIMLLPMNQCICVEMLQLHGFIQHGHVRIAVRLGEERALLGLGSAAPRLRGAAGQPRVHDG